MRIYAVTDPDYVSQRNRLIPSLYQQARDLNKDFVNSASYDTRVGNTFLMLMQEECLQLGLTHGMPIQ